MGVWRGPINRYVSLTANPSRITLELDSENNNVFSLVFYKSQHPFFCFSQHPDMKITQILARCFLSQPAVDWSDLPVDILQVIYENLKDMGVCIRFGAVCRQWRAIHLRCHNKIPPQPPMLLLPSRNDIVFSSNKCCNKKLTLENTSNDSIYCGSNFGWLIKITDFQVQLVNPFLLENNVIQLPDLPDNNISVRQAVLSHNPTWTSDYVVVIIYYSVNGRIVSNFAFYKSGKKVWNIVDDVDVEWVVLCGSYYNDRFYAMCLSGLMCWDLTSAVEDIMPTNVAPMVGYRVLEDDHPILHLVESRGELLCIVERDDKWKKNSTIGSKIISFLKQKGNSNVEIQIFRYENKDQAWTEVTSLGGQTIFLGKQSSISLDASYFPEYKPNHIYFHSWCYHQRANVNVGVYNVKDSSFDIIDCRRKGFPIWIHATFNKQERSEDCDEG